MEAVGSYTTCCSFFSFAIVYSDPVEVMVLSARNGVQAWRDAIGPTDPAEAKEHDPTW